MRHSNLIFVTIALAFSHAFAEGPEIAMDGSRITTNEAAVEEVADAGTCSFTNRKIPVSNDPKVLKLMQKNENTQTIQTAYNAVYSELYNNLHFDADHTDNPYRAYPAPKFPAVYLWDSAFISLVWKDWNSKVAESVIMTVIDGQIKDKYKEIDGKQVLQNAEDTGRIPHARNWLYKSKYSQPPLLSWAAMKIFKKSQDLSFLYKIYEPLLRYHQWYRRARQHESGLFHWLKSYESGIDNSQRFGSRDEKQMRDSTKILAIDLSSYMVLDAKALAEMASVVGDKKTAQEMTAWAAQLSQKINAHLWDAKNQRYNDFDLENNSFTRVYSIASLVPLTAGIPDKARAAQIISEVADHKKFNTVVPMPCVSRDDPEFEKDFWRGPVVMNMSYLALDGLKQYGYNDLAKDMAYRLVLGISKTYQNEKAFVEYYDPDRFDFSELTRKKGNLFKQITLGSKPVKHLVGWSGLMNTLIHENNFEQFKIESCDAN